MVWFSTRKDSIFNLEFLSSSGPDCGVAAPRSCVVRVLDAPTLFIVLGWPVDDLVQFFIVLARPVDHSIPFFIFLAGSIDHSVRRVGF